MTKPASSGAASPAPRWQGVASAAALGQVIAQSPMVWVLWGSAQCGVCQAIKPKLLELAPQHWPTVPMLYADCSTTPDACAQYRVFSLPVLRLFVGGKLAHEYVRAFSLQTVVADAARVQSLLG